VAKIEKQRVIVHILIWGAVWFLLILFFTEAWEDPLFLLHRVIPVIVSLLTLIAINLLYLLPKLYFKKKIGLYFLISSFLFIGIIWLLNNDLLIFSELTEKYNVPEKLFQQKRDTQSVTWLRFFIPLLISFVGSTLIELTHFANKKEKAAISLEKEKLDTEMKFLKSQINPHFLFNVLNNIYTLTVIKSDKAPDNLMRLSEMLRYMLYDSNDGKVPFQKEIEYLENYINLASLKDSRGLNIKVDFDKSQPGLMVAPLLFIPFVENAFKHSKIEDLKNGFINISLKTNHTQIEFIIENSIPNVAFTKDKVGGIGLPNTKQRLDLLYPNKHLLSISDSGKVYSVYLKLDLE
jgi:sensor histidine kinase YesM